MALFSKGIKLPKKADSTTFKLIETPPPKKVILPLKQYIGEPAQPTVKVGDKVMVPDSAITRKSKLPEVEKLKEVKESERIHMPELTVYDRRLSFKEVELGLDEKMTKGKSDRCLSCGLICYRKEGG